MSRDRYERKHRRTYRHPEVVAMVAGANHETTQSLAAAMGDRQCIHGGHFPCAQCLANRRTNAAAGFPITDRQFEDQYCLPETPEGDDMSTPDIDAYLAEIGRLGDERIEMNTTFRTLAALVGTVHLALRHPEFPPSVRIEIEGWHRQTVAAIRTVSPAIADHFDLGIDPVHDVARKSRRARP